MMLDKQALVAFSIFADAPCGDVCAARQCALALLADADLASEDLIKARLLISAALVHLQAGAGPEPTSAELHDLLLDLCEGVAQRKGFARSPMGFVRYVAAELAGGQLDDVLLPTTRIVAAAGPERREAPAGLAATLLSEASAPDPKACANPAGDHP